MKNELYIDSFDSPIMPKHINNNFYNIYFTQNNPNNDPYIAIINTDYIPNLQSTPFSRPTYFNLIRIYDKIMWACDFYNDYENF